MSRPPLLSRPFALGFAANFLHSLSFFFFLHLPGFLRQHTQDDFTIGLTMAAMAASAILARPLIGRIMDSRGRRVVALVGSALNIMFSAAYLLVDDVGPLLFVVRLGHGVAEGMLFSVFFTIAADVIPAERRAEGMALFGVSGMIPLSLAGLIGDRLLAVAGYQELFFAAIAAAVLGSLAALTLPELKPDTPQGPKRSFLAAAWAPALRPIWLVGFSFAFALASYFTFLKTFIDDTGVGSVGAFFTAYTVSAVVLRLALGWLPDRVGAKRVLVPSVWCAGAGLLVLAFGGTATSTIVAGVLCGIGHGYAFPIASAMVVMRTPAHERGRALAAFTALFDLGLFVGAPSLGFLLEQTSYATMFSAAAIVAVVGSVLYVFWDRETSAP
ncbi:MAG: MFS transporter [Nannocystaceae bacterium]|nr:MFS transporter [Nannocystaceae bacterium]